ncbi:MAG: PLP-dependent aminotransferase family protein [Gemmatimonadales bacterium]
MTMWTPEALDPGLPRYLAIADAIARDVARGVLSEGARLPTHRDLADRLGVTVGTITRGYAEAERRGLTVGEVGRGTFVRPRRAPEDFGWRDAARTGSVGGVIDMSLACPWIPPDGEEGQLLARTLEQITRSGPLDELMAYTPLTALPRHLAVAAEWIGGMGLQVSPEQVVATSGGQHAITVSLGSLLRPGDTVATAALTYPGLKAVAQMLGLRLAGVELDEEGIVPAALDLVCERFSPRALYCVPTLQNPTSATMSMARRQAIVEVARKRDLLVIEDEIHVAPRTERLTPLAAMAPERTVHITTLCKWATFGLRIGFAAVPRPLVERVRAGVRSSLWMPAPLMAEVATRWISDGTADRLGRRKLDELEARHALAREVFGDRFDVRTHPSAITLWVHLPEPQRSDECVARARQRGVGIAGAEAFAVGRVIPQAVRVAIGAVPRREDVRRGLEILADVFEGCSDPVAQIL